MHNDTWQLQEAKAKLSEVIREAGIKPQCVTYRGTETAYVVSPGVMHEYEMLKKSKSEGKKPRNWSELSAPLRKLKMSRKEVEALFGRDRKASARGTDEPLFD